LPGCSKHLCGRGIDQRDGFWFDHIDLKNGSLYFIKAGLVVYSINHFDEKKLKKEPVFKNFYSLNDAFKKIEIYFP
jgi:hypothetical protein